MRSSLLLTREFIYDSLYHPQYGYFIARDVISSPPTPIDFPRLRGEWDYQRRLSELYEAKRDAWTTPAEIFAPSYSQAIAEYILREHVHKNGKVVEELRVYEIGGGTGTNACCLLDHLATVAPAVYASMHMTLLEISSSMASRQRERLEAHAKVMGNRLSVIHGDVAQLWHRGDHDSGTPCPPLLKSMDKPCFVIGLEVLDNLPHDKVVWTEDEDGSWRLVAACVESEADGRFAEVLRPLEDAKILQTLEHFPAPPKPPAAVADDSDGAAEDASVMEHMRSLLSRAMRGVSVASRTANRAAFVPTGAVQLLLSLQEALPRHRLVLADFDAMPPPDVPSTGDRALDGTLDARGAPLVASKDPHPDRIGKTLDHGTYLVTKGTADIFFPSDFKQLARAAQSLRGGGLGGAPPPRVVKSAAFLREYTPDVSATRTRTGYNPLLEDFTNTSFLLT